MDGDAKDPVNWLGVYGTGTRLVPGRIAFKQRSIGVNTAFMPGLVAGEIAEVQTGHSQKRLLIIDHR